MKELVETRVADQLGNTERGTVIPLPLKSDSSTKRYNSVALTVVIAIFTLRFLSTAWLNDDAFITMRTVDNILRGYGLTWNTFERVQSYTHPLWMGFMLIARLITGEYILTLFTLSYIISVLSIILLIKALDSPKDILLLGIVLLTSKCFLDFSSSGLENPLVHLILAGAMVPLLFNERNKGLSDTKMLLSFTFLASCAYLTRPDALLFFLLPGAYLFISAARTNLRTAIYTLIVGGLPVIGWTLFSLFYYGFPFPNTAYAKLGSGAAQDLLWQNGWNYLWNSLTWDTPSLIIALLGIAAAFIWGGVPHRLVALSLLLFFAYLVNIGGDYMSGRFISAPYFLGVILLFSSFRGFNRRWLIAPVCIFAFLLTPRTLVAVMSGKSPPIYDKMRVADSTMRYTKATLGAFIRNDYSMPHPFYLAGIGHRERSAAVIISRAIGMEGFAAGPGKIFVDVYGLSDPLLARLPTIDQRRWRIGHFYRKIPPGYIESLKTMENRIKDPSLHDYYDKIILITRGPLLSKDRINTIVQMNLGRYDHLLAEYIASR